MSTAKTDRPRFSPGLKQGLKLGPTLGGGLRRDEHRGERGSVLLIVLSVLALLILISTTLTYQARVDANTAANHRQATQARMASLSGVSAAPLQLVLFTDTTAKTQRWAQPMGLGAADDPNAALLRQRLRTEVLPDLLQASGDTDLIEALQFESQREVTTQPVTPGPTFTNVSASASGSNEVARKIAYDLEESEGDREKLLLRSDTPPEMHDLRARDLAGSLNVNLAGTRQYLEGSGYDPEAVIAAGPADLDLVRFLQFTLEPLSNGKSLAPALAREIVERRLGSDGQPGRAGVDDNANSRWGRPGSDGVDNNANGDIDEPAESAMAINLVDDDITWVRRSIDDAGEGTAIWPVFSHEIEEETRSLIVNGRYDDIEAPSIFEGGLSQPRAGVDDPHEQLEDFRLNAPGDDRPFRHRSVFNALPAMTEEAAARLEPQATLVSASPNVARIGTRKMPRLNLNSAEPTLIHKRLREIYGNRVSDRQIAQYAANLADWRDPDRVPTRLNAGGGAEVLGLEIVPFITEVYPDSKTMAEDGDDGQFVEIYNPWPYEISIQGWRIRLGSRSISLTGTLPGEGYLIVTDDYNDENDEDEDQDSAARYGSFFGIFFKVPNGRTKQMEESTLLTLGDTFGKVELLDDRGSVIDVFDYAGRLGDGTTRSFQRTQPSQPATVVAEATPYAVTAGTDIDAMRAFFGHDAGANGERTLVRDRPFVDLADLLRVSSASLGEEPRDVRWDTPSIYDSSDNIDARVLDHLYLARPWPSRLTSLNLQGAELNDGVTRREVDEMSDQSIFWGHININTASLPVLMALPGMTEELASRVILQRRNPELRAFLGQMGASADIPWETKSEFLADDNIWGDLTIAERLRRFGQMANVISTSSVSFEITSYYMKRNLEDGGPAEQVRSVAACLIDGEDYDLLHLELNQ